METKFGDCAALRAAYRAARAVVDRLTSEDVPDGPVFDQAVDTEVDARDALKGAHVPNERELVANLACARELIGHDDVEWAETAAAIAENYLEQRHGLASA